MRSSALVLLALLTAVACTENQDLGDRPDVDGGLPFDGDDGDGESMDGDGPSPEPRDGEDDSTDNPGNNNGPDDFEFGSFEPFDVAASGIAASIWSTVGVTSVTGPTGCGIAAQPEGAPGEAGARAYANIYNGLVTTCPAGVYSIQNDPAACAIEPHSIDSDCAIYQRWDDDGELVANVLATGGAVAITREEVGIRIVCTVELSLRFPGGRVDQTFEFDVEPGEEQVCVR